MNKCKVLLIPITLAVISSGCSTTSTSPSSNADTVLPTTVVIPAASGEESYSSLYREIDEKDKTITSLERQLAQNNAELTELHISLDSKDALIAGLEASLSGAVTLDELEKQKRLRDSLESQYAELKVESDGLVSELKRLENENVALKQEASSGETTEDAFSTIVESDFLALNESFQALDSAHYKLSKEYRELLNKHQLLEKKFKTLTSENITYQKTLESLNIENQRLSDEISDQEKTISQLNAKISTLENERGTSIDGANSENQTKGQLERLQAQLAAQKALMEDYKSQSSQLRSELNEGSIDKAQLAALNNQLNQLKKLNLSVQSELDRSNDELLNARANEALLSSRIKGFETQESALRQELTIVQGQLSAIQEQVARSAKEKSELELQLNDMIPFQGEAASLSNQMNVTLRNVSWDVPNEMSLHDNFEIIVTAQVQSPVSGQTYHAELITDSAIQMLSNPKSEAVVRNGQVQWRWRMNGLNERPDATLNLTVSQEMNFQNRPVLRQLYSGSETIQLNNDNWFEKYGYWSGAIFLGLLIGFGVGFINRAKREA